MSETIHVGIIGGAGYTAGELIRILIYHPNVHIDFVQSKSSAGKALHEVHNDLIGDTELIFTEEIHFNVGVLFLCVGYGEALRFMKENVVPAHIKVIDLSHDFRLAHTKIFGQRTFLYGLPELNKNEIQHADSIANPGCFATALQLGLLPLAKQHLLKTIHSTGITGSTGAGQQLQSSSHFSWRTNNIQPYKTLTHQHLDEVKESLLQLQESNTELQFLPWRGDFSRGIFVSSYLTSKLEISEVEDMYRSFYAAHPFVHVSKAMIDLKQVINTNKAVIHLEKIGDQLVIHSAIDNLLKGASGQAVQNMNLMCGLQETTGLHLKASKF